MKKALLSVLLIAVLLMAAACSQPAPEEAKWTITIEAADGETYEFTDLDAADLTSVVVETNRTDKEGNPLDQSWTGLPLKAVLESVGITEYESCTIEASDGYSKDYPKEVVDNEETIMAWLLDGEEMDEEAGGPVQMIPKGQANNMFIKNLAKVIVK